MAITASLFVHFTQNCFSRKRARGGAWGSRETGAASARGGCSPEHRVRCRSPPRAWPPRPPAAPAPAHCQQLLGGELKLWQESVPTHGQVASTARMARLSSTKMLQLPRAALTIARLNRRSPRQPEPHARAGSFTRAAHELQHPLPRSLPPQEPPLHDSTGAPRGHLQNGRVFSQSPELVLQLWEIPSEPGKLGPSGNWLGVPIQGGCHPPRHCLGPAMASRRPCPPLHPAGSSGSASGGAQHDCPNATGPPGLASGVTYASCITST